MFFLSTESSTILQSLISISLLLKKMQTFQPKQETTSNWELGNFFINNQPLVKNCFRLIPTLFVSFGSPYVPPVNVPTHQQLVQLTAGS